MGARLVVEVFDDSYEPVCNVYFHWGAYTFPAFDALKELTSAIDNRDEDTDVILALIQKCEELGGGCDTDDLPLAQEKYPDHDFKVDGRDRNYGLVAFSPESMNKSRKDSDGDAQIDVDSRTCSNGCFWFFPDRESLIEDEGLDYEETLELDACPSADVISWDDIEQVEQAYSDAKTTYIETPDCYVQLQEG